MASKFQNRLAGTVVLVALGVIILPGLLDGQKKHYKEEFATIPLRPEPGNQQHNDRVPPATQSLPARPAGEVRQLSENSNDITPSGNDGGKTASASAVPETVIPPSVQQMAPQQHSPSEQKLSEPLQKRSKSSEMPKPGSKTAVSSEKAPAGQAWVIQLAALKNASRVEEIIAQLRLSGYRAFTVPATPVQGTVTRIYVGPNASRTKMQAVVAELQTISGLEGVVKPWRVP